MKDITIIECPRDAMQGWHQFIPTEKKREYINALLKVGFEVIDFGSFVSSKAIPQMADTREVLRGLDLSGSRSRLLAIVANLRGAQEAAQEENIHFLGYPFSISETFQRRNTNSSIIESFETVKAILDVCEKANKKLVVYISMGFGNPYGDSYNINIVQEWVGAIAGLGIEFISIADTVGLATPEQVKTVLSEVIAAHGKCIIGAHLHSSPEGRAEKIQAALDAGCRRFDSAIKGIGGCPMAGDSLIGNMDTEFMLDYFKKSGWQLSIDESALRACSQMASGVFI